VDRDTVYILTFAGIAQSQGANQVHDGNSIGGILKCPLLLHTLNRWGNLSFEIC